MLEFLNTYAWIIALILAMAITFGTLTTTDTWGDTKYATPIAMLLLFGIITGLATTIESIIQWFLK